MDGPTSYTLPVVMQVGTGPAVTVTELDVVPDVDDVVLMLSDALRLVAEAMRQQREREIRAAARRAQIMAHDGRTGVPILKPLAGAHG